MRKITDNLTSRCDICKAIDARVVVTLSGFDRSFRFCRVCAGKSHIRQAFYKRKIAERDGKSI